MRIIPCIPLSFSSVDFSFSNRLNNPRQIPYFSNFYRVENQPFNQRLKQKPRIILATLQTFSHLLSFRKIFCFIKIIIELYLLIDLISAKKLYKDDMKIIYFVDFHLSYFRDQTLDKMFFFFCMAEIRVDIIIKKKIIYIYKTKNVPILSEWENVSSVCKNNASFLFLSLF